MQDNQNLRYIPYQQYSPYLKTALNEVLIESVYQTKQPLFWLAGWDRDCINVGVSQDIYKILDYQRVLNDQIPVVRRQSGGGAMILSKNGEITWNLIIPENTVENNINQWYRDICGKIVNELNVVGIYASFKPINDIITLNGKISGATLRKKNGVIYIAGTLLYKKDKDKMEKYLKPENDTIKKDSIRENQKSITSIEEESNLSFDQTIQLLERSFLKNNNYKQYTISKEELKKAQKLEKLYTNKNWIEQAKNDIS